MSKENTGMDMISEIIRKPCGADPRFSTLDLIKSNYLEFVKKTHGAYKDLHRVAIGAVINFDLEREAIKKREGETAANFRHYNDLLFNKLIWMKANDALAWVILGERHLIKRLCLSKKRENYLHRTTHPSNFTALEKINANPLCLAILSDATSCIDVGDILVSNKLDGTVETIELKSGTANSEIPTALESPESMQIFLDRYGDKGKKQIERVKRQQDITNKAFTLIKTDEGVDPCTGQFMNLLQTETAVQTTDACIQDLILKANFNGMATALIDGCLWLCASSQKNKTLEEVSATFFDHVKAKTRGPVSCVHNILEGIYYPFAQPIFLRNIPSEHVNAIFAKDLRILMCLDWDGYEKLVQNSGLTFSWSSIKDGGRASSKPQNERPLLVEGRVPIVSKGKVKCFITGPSMIQIFYDGHTPGTVLSQTNETLDYLLRKSDDK